MMMLLGLLIMKSIISNVIFDIYIIIIKINSDSEQFFDCVEELSVDVTYTCDFTSDVTIELEKTQIQPKSLTRYQLN